MQIATLTVAGETFRHQVDLPDGSMSHVTMMFGELYEPHDGPSAFLAEFRPAPGKDIRPHFHRVAQFQVVVGGDGRIGKKQVPPVSFHYADAFSPYGPIVSAVEERGIDFFTLRPLKDPRVASPMPGSRDQMEGRKAGRNMAFSLPRRDVLSRGVEREVMIERHEDGLSAVLIRLGSDETAETSDPSSSGGQYCLVAQGSLVHEAAELPRNSLIWIGPDDSAVSLHAGGDGADVLVLQYPVDVL